MEQKKMVSRKYLIELAYSKGEAGIYSIPIKGNPVRIGLKANDTLGLTKENNTLWFTREVDVGNEEVTSFISKHFTNVRGVIGFIKQSILNIEKAIKVKEEKDEEETKSGERKA